ncbi:MAG: helix-turn-helix domain-containing protein [Candidatus Gracilibacteria bacterium]|nr:helix-turn-helix domain-containing protein [Candidatus Gracilibacteria bacterium]
MKYIEILSKIGLTKEESMIYLDLLENHESNIVTISDRTGINRPALYKLIPNLVETGLISKVIKGKRNVFKAESPKNLTKLFNTLSNNFNFILPDLEEVYESNDNKPLIKFYNGIKGIKNIFEDVINTLGKGDTYYRYSSRNVFGQKYYPTTYSKFIEENKITRYVITSEKISQTKIQKVRREMVVIPKKMDLFEDNFAKIIYKNKVAVIDYNSLTGFIIENQLFAKFEEKLFKLLFKLIKSIH